MAELTTFEKIRRLHWQIIGNVANQWFCLTSFFGAVFILFLDELGMDKAKIGLILSLFPFCNLIALFSAPYNARFGFKKMFVLFYGLRVLFVITVLPAPILIYKFGPGFTFLWIAVSVFCYALCKAIGETALFAWYQELIPNVIRGKFSAISGIIQTAASIATISVVSFVLARWQGLNIFISLMAAGLIGGLLQVWFFSFCPGGAAEPQKSSHASHRSDLICAFKDKTFLWFNIGFAVVTLGTSLGFAFISLYMKEQIGLPTGQVVTLDIGIYLGCMLSSYFIGWAADRYGSKSIMLCGICLFFIIPICCLLLPQKSLWSFPLAFVTTFFLGTANMAWGIGFNRYLYNNAVNIDRKSTYTSLFFANLGLSGGIGPILAGKAMVLFQTMELSLFGMAVSAYAAVFFIGVLIIIVGLGIMSSLSAKGDLPLPAFLRLFAVGNGPKASWLLLGLHYTQNDQRKAELIRKLGKTRSPLGHIEIIHALTDACYAVRLEAVMAIANLRKDPAFVAPLTDILNKNEPELSLHAIRAMQTQDFPQSRQSLQAALGSSYPLVRVGAARSLASLNDRTCIARILQLFDAETNPELKTAFGYGLAVLGYTKHINTLLTLAATLPDAALRAENGLSAAVLIGRSQQYTTILQKAVRDETTTLAQAAWSLKKRLHLNNKDPLTAALIQAASQFANINNRTASELLDKAIQMLPQEQYSDLARQVLTFFSDLLNKGMTPPLEFVVLAVHATAYGRIGSHHSKPQNQ